MCITHIHKLVSLTINNCKYCIPWSHSSAVIFLSSYMYTRCLHACPEMSIWQADQTTDTVRAPQIIGTALPRTAKPQYLKPAFSQSSNQHLQWSSGILFLHRPSSNISYYRGYVNPRDQHLCHSCEFTCFDDQGAVQSPWQGLSHYKVPESQDAALQTRFHCTTGRPDHYLQPNGLANYGLLFAKALGKRSRGDNSNHQFLWCVHHCETTVLCEITEFTQQIQQYV